MYLGKREQHLALWVQVLFAVPTVVAVRKFRVEQVSMAMFR
jgi:hypothetical protein